MKRIWKFALMGVMVGGMFSCEQDSMEAVNPQPHDQALDGMASDVATLLNNPTARKTLLSTLENKEWGVKLETLLLELDAAGVASPKTLAQSVEASKKSLANGAMPDEVKIPELFLVAPEGQWSEKDLLVAFPPAGDEKAEELVKAYNAAGEVVYLSQLERPEVPVIVVENHGHFAFVKEVELMNRMLQEAGLQVNNHMQAISARSASGIEVTKLDKIRLNNDQEPWTKGGAEIYAVTSGIRNTSKDPEVAVIPMEYLDDDGKNYYPNQIMLFWDDYVYAAANIHYYEKDSGYNYKELTIILINGVTEIAGILSGQAYITALGKIAAAVAQAIPDDWYTDDDDYVDTFYTIEKNHTYTDYYGAAGNARVTLTPYFIPAN